MEPTQQPNEPYNQDPRPPLPPQPPAGPGANGQNQQYPIPPTLYNMPFDPAAQPQLVNPPTEPMAPPKRRGLKLLLVLLILIALGAAAYLITAHFVSQSNKPAASTAKSAAHPQTKTYKTSDGVVSFAYPHDWVTDSCKAPKTCSAAYKGIDTFFSPAAHPTWQVISLQHTESNLTAKQYFDQSSGYDDSTMSIGNINTKRINGYDTYSATVSVDSDGNDMSTNYYVFSHKGQVAELRMTVNYDSTSSGYHNTQAYTTQLDQIAQSVAFHN